MTIKHLCKSLVSLGKEGIEKDLAFSEFFHKIKNGYSIEVLRDFTKSDLVGLDIHSLCHVLAIYEYILISLNICEESILKEHEGVFCPMESNEVYLLLFDCFGREQSKYLYDRWLNDSIEPFKSRGIIAKEFNYAV